MKVCIDPGHGGNDPGAIGFDPYYVEEKLINLAIGRSCQSDPNRRRHCSRDRQIIRDLAHTAERSGERLCGGWQAAAVADTGILEL